MKNKGQSAWFDIILIFMCIAIFTATIWTFNLNGKAAKTQMKRSRQDYTNSLLISMLYTTLDAENPKYRGKTISDVIGMHFANPDKVKKEFVIDSIKEYAKIQTYMKDKGSSVDSEIEWFLYGEHDETILCIHGTGDTITECGDYVESYDVNSACVEITYPTGENTYGKIPLYLRIKWSQ